MNEINEKLREYGLTIFESEADDREVVDFSVYSDELEDNVAWAWGEIIATDNKEYIPDYEVECSHQVEWGDDDEMGYCVVCGQACRWHWEKDVVDEGHDEDGNYTCKTGEVRVIDQWEGGDGGVIKQYVERCYEVQRREQ